MDERQAGGDDLVRALVRWAGEQRIADAAESRARERSLRDQAGASATWAGVLVDLAERDADVILTVATRRRAGRLVGVGPDFCVVHQGGGRPALVAMSAIASVTVSGSGSTPDSGSARPVAVTPAGDRAPGLELSFAAALGGLADERAPVALWLGADEILEGELWSAGQDVLTVRTATGAVHVPLQAVMICELR